MYKTTQIYAKNQSLLNTNNKTLLLLCCKHLNFVDFIKVPDFKNMHRLNFYGNQRFDGANEEHYYLLKAYYQIIWLGLFVC